MGLFSGGLTAKVDVSKMASFGLARKQVEKGYAAIPLGGIKGYMNKLSISGAAGITGSGLLGNYFAEFAMDLFNIE